MRVGEITAKDQYTLTRPRGPRAAASLLAHRREPLPPPPFLALPVALLAGGLCGWAVRRVMLDGLNLTALAGLCVLLIAAATPAVAWGPFSFRMGTWPDVPNPAEDRGDFHFDYIAPMRAYT